MHILLIILNYGRRLFKKKRKEKEKILYNIYITDVITGGIRSIREESTRVFLHLLNNAYDRLHFKFCGPNTSSKSLTFCDTGLRCSELNCNWLDTGETTSWIMKIHFLKQAKSSLFHEVPPPPSRPCIRALPLRNIYYFRFINSNSYIN